VGGLFFDLERALDCINYGIILAALEFMDVQTQHVASSTHILKTDIKESAKVTILQMKTQAPAGGK